MFEEPSPIQGKAIKPMMNGKDLLAQAQSGTGEQGIFPSSLLTVNLKKKYKLLFYHLRVNCQQSNVITSLSNYMGGLKNQLLVGGTSVYSDTKTY